MDPQILTAWTQVRINHQLPRLRFHASREKTTLPKAILCLYVANDILFEMGLHLGSRELLEKSEGGGCDLRNLPGSEKCLHHEMS